jgi:hypothetical protein
MGVRIFFSREGKNFSRGQKHTFFLKQKKIRFSQKKSHSFWPQTVADVGDEFYDGFFSPGFLEHAPQVTAGPSLKSNLPNELPSVGETSSGGKSISSFYPVIQNFVVFVI